MSNEARDWAYEQKIQPPELKFLCVTLGDAANAKHRFATQTHDATHFSYEGLGKKMTVSRRTVARLVKRLPEVGIEVLPKKFPTGNDGACNVYLVPINGGEDSANSGTNSPAEDSANGGRDSANGGQDSANGGQDSANSGTSTPCTPCTKVPSGACAQGGVGSGLTAEEKKTRKAVARHEINQWIAYVKEEFRSPATWTGPVQTMRNEWIAEKDLNGWVTGTGSDQKPIRDYVRTFRGFLRHKRIRIYSLPKGWKARPPKQEPAPDRDEPDGLDYVEIEMKRRRKEKAGR